MTHESCHSFWSVLSNLLIMFLPHMSALVKVSSARRRQCNLLVRDEKPHRGLKDLHLGQ